MIHTLLQILVFQLLFLVVYDLFLKKETFFNLNRIYLLLTPILSVVLPFVSIGFIQQNIPQEFYAQMPAVILGETASKTGSTSLLWFMSLKNLWTIGMIVSTLIFCYKIFKIIKLKRSGTTKYVDGNRLTMLPKTDTAFSFFNTIYLGENISEENKENIIAHEKTHVQQKHSLDLLYFELLRIVFWFNPLVYIFQNRISTLHEYIVDAEISRRTSKKDYYQNLLSEVFQTEKISFVNTFYKKSLIKNRITMLEKSKSTKNRMMKYLLMLPLLGGMLIYTSCVNDSVESLNQEQETMNQLPPPPPPPPPPAPPVPPAYKESGDEVPYAVIQKVPTYPGCTGDNEALKECMSTKIAEAINANFNTDIAGALNLSGRQRITVQFKIDKTGTVTDIRARAPQPELEAEAIRVVKLLPKMTPGEHRGEKVGVLYSLPIVFEVE